MNEEKIVGWETDEFSWLHTNDFSIELQHCFSIAKIEENKILGINLKFPYQNFQIWFEKEEARTELFSALKKILLEIAQKRRDTLKLNEVRANAQLEIHNRMAGVVINHEH